MYVCMYVCMCLFLLSILYCISLSVCLSVGPSTSQTVHLFILSIYIYSIYISIYSFYPVSHHNSLIHLYTHPHSPKLQPFTHTLPQTFPPSLLHSLTPSLPTEHNLTLVPSNDYLKHRPRTCWEVQYLCSELRLAQVWLQSAMQECDVYTAQDQEVRVYVCVWVCVCVWVWVCVCVCVCVCVFV